MLKSLFLPLIIAYLIGAIPTGFLLGRLLTGKDIRKLGSGNPGTANALRVLGKLPAVIVFILDVGKGLAAIYVMKIWGGTGEWLWWGAAAAVIGHIYPVTMGFRGGKGLATGLAAVSVLQPITILIFVLIWAVVFIPSRQMAPASSLGMFGVLIMLLFSWHLPGVLGATAIIWRHWPETLVYVKALRKV